jgi:hypothetical protein
VVVVIRLMSMLDAPPTEMRSFFSSLTMNGTKTAMLRIPYIATIKDL